MSQTPQESVAQDKPTDEVDAAAWFVRTGGELSEHGTHAFAAWLGMNPDHSAAYEAILAAWRFCLEAGNADEFQEMRTRALLCLSSDPSLPLDSE